MTPAIRLGTWTATGSPGCTPRSRKAAAQRAARSTRSASDTASLRPPLSKMTGTSGRALVAARMAWGSVWGSSDDTVAARVDEGEADRHPPVGPGPPVRMHEERADAAGTDEVDVPVAYLDCVGPGQLGGQFRGGGLEHYMDRA